MRKGDEKRQAILDVAEKLFYAKGYEATSVQDILDVLSTSKGSFYHHFESKERVLATLCAQRAERAAEQAQQRLADLQSPLARLNLTLLYAMPLRRGEEKFLALLLPLLDKPEGLSLRVCYQDALAEGFAPLVRRALAECKASGDIFAPENPCLPGLLLGLTNQCWLEAARELLRSAREGRPLDSGTLVDVLDMYRFALERLLEAPFASLELLRVEEALEALQPALTQLKLPMRL